MIDRKEKGLRSAATETKAQGKLTYLHYITAVRKMQAREAWAGGDAK